MQFITGLFTRDSLFMFLGEFNINSSNGRRCDLLNRSRLIAYFDLHDKYGRESLGKVIDLANKPSVNPITRMKYIMLLHSLILSSPMFYDFILEHQIIMPQVSNEVNTTPEKSVKNWVQSATIQYYNFIRRICLHKEIYEQCKMRTRHPQDWEDTIQTIYMLINLVKSIFPIKEFILNIGRYFCADYLFVADINRILALDLLRMYNNISFLAQQLYVNYQAKLSRTQAKQLLNIVDEVYLVHEEMYIMMYNRYYFAYMQLSNPYWFKLETKDYEKLKDYALQNDKSQRKNLTMDDIDLNQFEKTYFELVKNRAGSEDLPDI